MQTHLFTPGPVDIPEEVLSIASMQPLGHRNSAFYELMERIQTKLSSLLRSAGPVVILPSSGTGALEALCSNLIEEGDKVLSVSCGVFGDRFRNIAGLFGAEIIPVDIPLGCRVEPEKVGEALARNQGVKVILLTQNETSTGVMNPINDIVGETTGPDRPLVLVDAVSSLGAMPCFPEEWNIDGLASCSQKGLLIPPGLGLVWLSERAWEKRRSIKSRRGYYFDLLLHREYLDKPEPQNPFTPPVSLMRMLDRSLSIILDYGLDNWFLSKKRISETFIAGAEAMGLSPFVDKPEARSWGVSSVLFPGYSATKVQESLTAMGIIAAGGQGDVKGRLMRFAHYSDQSWPEICMLLGSIYGALVENGIHARPDYISTAWKSWKGEF